MSGTQSDRKFRGCPETVETAIQPSLPAVGQGEVRIGDIESKGSIQILGHVEGDVRANRIVIAACAKVDGGLLARTVHVDGTVNGPIMASRVSLGPTACVKGNIAYEAFNVATGASVSGFCHDRTRTELAHCDAGGGAGASNAAFVLPFSRARAACARSSACMHAMLTERKPVLRTRSMKAVWHAYEQGRIPG